MSRRLTVKPEWVFEAVIIKPNNSLYGRGR